jgi:hypothetical protein
MDNLELEQKVNIIMTQTNYSREEVIEKLTELKTCKKVIQSYIINQEKTEKTDNTDSDISVNQKIYKEIRDFCDNSTN